MGAATRQAQGLKADARAFRTLAEHHASLAPPPDDDVRAWVRHARRHRLPLDLDGVRAHQRCARAVAKLGARRGAPLWAPRDSMPLRRTPQAWRHLESFPTGVRGRLATDALSFPLTAAWLTRRARLADVRVLSLVVLGAEVGELGARSSDRAKWLSLLCCLPAVGELHVRFVGPGVPQRLDGLREELRDNVGRKLFLLFETGRYHDVPRTDPAPQLAIAFNAGLADFARDWLPTLRVLFGEGTSFACTAYHEVEAELDGRLAVLAAQCAQRSGVASRPLALGCAARRNPFASRVPNLDPHFPGRTFAANSFATLIIA